MCTSTVRTDRHSRAAMSRLVRPRAASMATAVSRRVSACRGPDRQAARAEHGGLASWTTASAG